MEWHLYLFASCSAVPYFCRPFVRACLFQSSNRQRLAELLSSAASNESRHALLESEAAVELAAQAAMACQWDQCALQAATDIQAVDHQPCATPWLDALHQSGLHLVLLQAKHHMGCN